MEETNTQNSVNDIFQRLNDKANLLYKFALLYGDYAAASQLRFRAGEAAVFFPKDGHMPSLRAGATAQLVRKTVVKVPVPA